MASKPVSSVPTNPKVNNAEVRQAGPAGGNPLPPSSAVLPSLNGSNASNNNSVSATRTTTIASPSPITAPTQGKLNPASAPFVPSSAPAKNDDKVTPPKEQTNMGPPSAGPSSAPSIAALGLTSPKTSPPNSPGVATRDPTSMAPKGSPWGQDDSPYPKSSSSSPSPDYSDEEMVDDAFLVDFFSSFGSPSENDSCSGDLAVSSPQTPRTPTSTKVVDSGKGKSPTSLSAPTPAPSPAPKPLDKNNNNNTLSSLGKRKDPPQDKDDDAALTRVLGLAPMNIILCATTKRQAVVPNGADTDESPLSANRLRRTDKPYWISIIKVNKGNSVEQIRSYLINTKGLELNPVDMIFKSEEGKLYISVQKETEYDRAVTHRWAFGILDHGPNYDPRSPKGFTYRILYLADCWDFADTHIRIAYACARQHQVTVTVASGTKNPEIGVVTFDNIEDWVRMGAQGRIDGTIKIGPTDDDSLHHILTPLLPLASTDNISVDKIYYNGAPPGTDDVKLNGALRYHATTGGFDPEVIYFSGVQRNRVTGAPLNYGFIFLHCSATNFFLANPTKLRNTRITFSTVKEAPIKDK